VSAKTVPSAKFHLGRIVATPHALETIPSEDILAGIARHQAGDWGDVPPEDAAANDRALVDGTRILSAYRSAKGITFWTITEADRSSTCVLLPEDY
jgi:hypothetical protein